MTDTTGAVIPEAKVTLVNIGTAEKHVMETSTEGLYQFVSLLPLILTTAQNLTDSFGGGSRPNSNGQNPDLSGSAVSRLGKWFNTSDFSQPASFTYGNVGRTLPNVRTDGLANLDVALFKDTTFGPNEKMDECSARRVSRPVVIH